LVERVDAVERSLNSVRDIVKATNLPLQAEDARKSLDELSQRIARLEDTGAVSDLKQNLEQLDAENQQISATVAEISERMRGLEATDTAADAKARATVLAAGDLREALRAAAPFTAELDALRAAASGQPEIEKILDELAPLAAAGVPTLTTLTDRFDRVARDVSSAARRIEGDGWMATVVNRLASLVSIRRTDDGDGGDSVDGVLVRAESALADGDLIGAVNALESLTDAPAEAAAGWLADARARVLAERAMAVLHVHAVSLMAPAAR
jgi:hypothetical protein